ncbi:hypothetical protein CV102_13925 [Natronococcus pandeyae]|uniref:Uncharacterized protein n=1 Tax=Natronococcus pandeyae TaxID=2055836 RepID=A0A8J8Q2B5_9EURY|nr:hypothetical protein CV102_13925 [Natronococcus pandeyae]
MYLESDDEGQPFQNNRSGIRLETTAVVDGLECRLSAETAGILTAYLTDDSGEILERQSVATLEAGDTFAFERELAADETYWILCDARGRNYVRGRAAVEYPLESDRLAVTHGIYAGDGAQSSSYRYCIDRIRTGETATEIGDALDLERDDEGQSWSGLSNQSGVRVQPTQAITGLACRISAETEGLTTAYLTDDEGTVLDQQAIAELEAGDVFSFETDLLADEAYWVVCDAEGDDYVRGRAAVDYPIASDSLAVTHGIFAGDGAQSDSYRYCLDWIQPTVSGMVGALDLGRDDEGQSWGSLTHPSGVRFEATDHIDGLECRLSAESEGLVTAYLTDDSGAVLERQLIATLEAGDTFAFDTELAAGGAYRIVCDARGQAYVRGRAAVDYPLQYDSLEVTHGIYNGTEQSENYRYCLDQIRPEPGDPSPLDELESGISMLELERETETLGLGSDTEGEAGYSGRSGVRLRTTEAVHGLECRLSGETEATRAYLTDDEGSVLSEQSVADLEAGETVVFNTALEADEAYWVVCDGGGDPYTRGRARVDYPLESESLVATEGIHGGSLRTSSVRFCIDRVRTIEVEDDLAALDLGADTASQSQYSSRSGVRLRTTEAVSGLECRLSAETEASTAYLTDDEGSVLSEQSVADLEAGETVVFTADLPADEAYWVVCDGGGDPYTRGRARVDYPLESEFLVATEGIHGGSSRTSSFRFCFDRIRTTAASRGLLAALDTPSLGVTTVDVSLEPSIDVDGDLAAELRAYLARQDEVNHEFVLPMGSYDWNTQFVLNGPIRYFGISGDPRATLQIQNPDIGLAFEFGRWGSDNPPQHVVLRNVDVDISDQPERDAGLITAHVGRCLIDNVELVGQRWSHGPESGDRYTCMVNTREESALSVIRNLSLPDGEVEDPDEPSVGHSIGISADPPHTGIDVWTQCYVEEFVDNGFYVRNSPGDNIIAHSMAVNCGNGNLRLGEADEALDCRLRLDTGSEQDYPGAGLWLNGGQPIAERIAIDASGADNDVVRINSGADGGQIRGLDLFCGVDVVAPTIRCTETSDTDPSGVLIEDFAIDDTTEADSNASIRVRRPDVTLRSGLVAAEHREALGGSEDPELEDVEFQ